MHKPGLRKPFVYTANEIINTRELLYLFPTICSVKTNQHEGTTADQATNECILPNVYNQDFPLKLLMLSVTSVNSTSSLFLFCICTDSKMQEN